MIKNLLILLVIGTLSAGYTLADDHKDERQAKSERIKDKSKDGHRDDDAKARWEDEQERRRERDQEARERREEERERRRERDEEARERWEEEQERREDEAEEARERWEDERERKKDKHKKDKHKHKSKKPDGVHGRDWGSGQGEKRGWSGGKPGGKGDRQEAGKPYDGGHDHNAHDPAGDEHTPEHGGSDNGATDPQNPEQTLRDMAKDAAARKAGAEKGSATEALIHMGTDMVIDRSTGKGGDTAQ